MSDLSLEFMKFKNLVKTHETVKIRQEHGNINININIRENVQMFDCRKLYVQREVTPHITS